MAELPLPVTLHADSHVGLVHPKNEDSYAVVPAEDGGLLLVVCDGMGGMGKGDQASALAVATLTRSLTQGSGFPPDRMRLALQEADVRVRDELCGLGEGLPGATAVIVYLLGGLAHVAWVGDSRAYLIRDGTVSSRTTDHKLVEELVAAGQLTADEAKASALAHVVTRALGGRSSREAPVKVAVLPRPWLLRHGDLIVLCSDGVCDLIDDHELPGLVGNREPAEATQVVIQEVLERGAHDNTTLIVARWDGPDTPASVEEATPIFATPRVHDPTSRTQPPGDPREETAVVEEPEVHEPDRGLGAAAHPEPTSEPAPIPEPEPAPDPEPNSDPDPIPEPGPDPTPTPGEPDDRGSMATWQVALAVAIAILLGLGALFAVKTLFSMQVG